MSQPSAGAGAAGTVRNCQIDQAGRDGIDINSSSNNLIEGCTITNSANVTASRDGIRIETSDAVNADYNEFDGNECTDNQGTKTQRYGININPDVSTEANYNRITNNDLAGNNVGPYNDAGTDTVIYGNET